MTLNWQHYVMLAAGAVGAGVTYLLSAAPEWSGVEQAVIAVCGAIVLLLGHTSPSAVKS